MWLTQLLLKETIRRSNNLKNYLWRLHTKFISMICEKSLFWCHPLTCFGIKQHSCRTNATCHRRFVLANIFLATAVVAMGQFSVRQIILKIRRPSLCVYVQITWRNPVQLRASLCRQPGKWEPWRRAFIKFKYSSKAIARNEFHQSGKIIFCI